MSQKEDTTTDQTEPCTESTTQDDTMKCASEDCTTEDCNKKICMPSIDEEKDLPEDDSPFADPNTRGQLNLLEVEVNSPNTALNVIVGFLGIAQKRGSFAINESAKIYECINYFS